MKDNSTAQLVERLWSLHRRAFSYASDKPAVNLLLADLGEGIKEAIEALTRVQPSTSSVEAVARARELALSGEGSPDDLGGDIVTMSLRNPDGPALLEIIEALTRAPVSQDAAQLVERLRCAAFGSDDESIILEAADLIEALTRVQPSTSSVEAVARVFMQRGDDCFQAAIATLLGLPLSAVPRFDEEAIPGKNQNRMARAWLQSLGYVMEVWLADIRRTVEGFHIACGTSPRGCGHAVVYRGNDLFHDPHPEGGGLVGEIDQFIIIRPEHPALPSPHTGSVEAVARVLSRHMHDSRERAWDDGLVTDGQKAEAIAAAEAAIAALPSPEREPMREARDKIILILDANYHTAISKARSTADQIIAALAPPPAQSGDRT